MNSETLPGITLGQYQDYPDRYDQTLLRPIERQIGRQHLPSVAFSGYDVWTAFELSWLDNTGKPKVAVAEVTFPHDSRCIVESKSLKYYLNSFNQTPFANAMAVQETLTRDLSHVVEGQAAVRLFSTSAFVAYRAQRESLGECLDHLPLEAPDYYPNPSLLEASEDRSERIWFSHLLKTNCPVTGQPDWATLWVGYRGQTIEPRSLLRYVVSYRQHQDFHEQCVERIFCDLWRAAELDDLWVYARYTRRGGLDINPFRSSSPRPAPLLWGDRQ